MLILLQIQLRILMQEFLLKIKHIKTRRVTS